MKFQVGDFVILKECKNKYNLILHPCLSHHPRLHLRLHLRLELHNRSHLKNTYGIITEVFNTGDAWGRESTVDNNIYFWYSQVDAKTYWFCEDELTEYEVVK